MPGGGGFALIERAADEAAGWVEHLSPQTRNVLRVIVEDFGIDPLGENVDALTDEMIRCAFNSCRVRGLI